MKRTIIYFYFAIFTSAFPSCNRKPVCLNDYAIYEDFKISPALSIVEPLDHSDCSFRVMLYLCVKGESIQNEAILKYMDGSIMIKLLNPSSNYFSLFKLDADAGKIYESNVQFNSNAFGLDSAKIKIRLEDKLNHGEILVYRGLDFFCYDDEPFDIVYFVSPKRAVVGSYISKIHLDGSEFYTSPAGNIFPELIDYSKKIEGVLK